MSVRRYGVYIDVCTVCVSDVRRSISFGWPYGLVVLVVLVVAVVVIVDVSKLVGDQFIDVCVRVVVEWDVVIVVVAVTVVGGCGGTQR